MGSTAVKRDSTFAPARDAPRSEAASCPQRAPRIAISFTKRAVDHESITPCTEPLRLFTIAAYVQRSDVTCVSPITHRSSAPENVTLQSASSVSYEDRDGARFGYLRVATSFGAVTIADKSSRFILAMKPIEMPFGQAASHS